MADRWHLGKNLTESVETLLARCRAEIRRALHMQAWPVKERAETEPVLEEEKCPARTRREEEARLARRAQKLDRYEWHSKNPQFRQHNIPLIHHLAVFPQFQRQGIASRLMDMAEQLIATCASTVGLFDAYGPAQRLYARRGYMPDGRGACQGQRPLKQGETVTVDHDLILWLTKDLGYFHDIHKGET